MEPARGLGLASLARRRTGRCRATISARLVLRFLLATCEAHGTAGFLGRGGVEQQASHGRLRVHDADGELQHRDTHGDGVGRGMGRLQREEQVLQRLGVRGEVGEHGVLAGPCAGAHGGTGVHAPSEQC